MSDETGNERADNIAEAERDRDRAYWDAADARSARRAVEQEQEQASGRSRPSASAAVTRDIERAVASVIAGGYDWAQAAGVVGALSRHSRSRLATEALMQLARSRGRAAALEVERAAEDAYEDAHQAAIDARAEADRAVSEAEAEVSLRRAEAAGVTLYHLWTDEERRFGCPSSRSRDRSTAEGERKYTDWINSDMPTAVQRREWNAESEREGQEIDRAFFQRMAEIIDDYEASLRLKWTRELLDSEIAMPDGTRVSWGEATIDQHEQRIEMFLANATANAEGAARHQKAIHALKDGGADTLNDLVQGDSTGAQGLPSESTDPG